MKASFQDKIKNCQHATKSQLAQIKEFKCKIEEGLVFDSLFSEDKFKGKDSFLDLWNCYGLSHANLTWLNVGLQSNVTLYHIKFDLMERWFQILFGGSIAFRPFFDIEIEHHNRIRKDAERKGIKHLVLIVDFDKIAKIIDNHFISIEKKELNINSPIGDAITPLAAIDDVLVEAILKVPYTSISEISVLKKWIYKVITTENQTLTERLDNLNVLANSLYKARESTNHVLAKSYINGLYSQILKWIHETLDLVEWLCDTQFEKLDKPLISQFRKCSLIHRWESKIGSK